MSLTKEQNERLTMVSPDTVMGQFLRRHWIAALPSSQLPDPDGVPKRIRLLGEDLVAFRDTTGRVGILGLHCPHRGAGLDLARNENCVLQCIYHGWRVDADGNVNDTPNEPPISRFKERVKQKSYTVEEKGGFIWAYMGPKGTESPLPGFEWMDMADDRRLIEQVQVHCNWLQAIENSLDSSHTPFLHSDTLRPLTEMEASQDPEDVYDGTGSILEFRPSVELNAKVEVLDESFGLRICALRTPIEEPERDVYARMSMYVAPWYYAIPPPPGRGAMPFYVPIDDEHTMLYNVRFSFSEPLDEAGIRKLDGTRIGIDINPDFTHTRNEANGWLQDRDAMPDREHYSGIRGVIAQDVVALESMGAVADRTREHLGSSDIAVIRTRELLMAALDRFEVTGDIGDFHAGAAAISVTRPWQKVIARAIPWQDVDPRHPAYFEEGPLLVQQ